jgi:hypothetical protein
MSDFTAKRVVREYTQVANAAPDVVFPLLSPVKESEWLDGWKFTMLYSKSGEAETDCVYKTQHSVEEETLWTITKYDAEAMALEFVRLTNNVSVIKIEVAIEDNHNGSCIIRNKYTFTSISERGNEFVEGNSARSFEKMMQWREKSLNYYLGSGSKLMGIQLGRSQDKEEDKK